MAKRNVEKAVEEYHKKFYPEVIVGILDDNPEELKFEFSGHFCYTCGVTDYFDDFAETLSKHLGKKYMVVKKEKIGEEENVTWLVLYAPEKNVEKKEEGGTKYLIIDPITGEETEIQVH